MVCYSGLRSVILQADQIGIFPKGGVLFNNLERGLNATQSLIYLWNHKFTTRKMMVDTSETVNRGTMIDAFPEKDDNGSYASGRWKR